MGTMSKPVKAIPDGYQAVIPYLVVDGAEKLMEFLKGVFHAKELLRMPGPDGKIGHAEVRIGDCVVMLADAQGPYKPMPAMIYVYLEDVDAAYQRALEAGAVSDREPKDQFYGDRTAGVTDACGNRWYIGTHIEDVSPEELMRRQKAQ
jgi:PhnB protein